jgi:hypothetical protein
VAQETRSSIPSLEAERCLLFVFHLVDWSTAPTQSDARMLLPTFQIVPWRVKLAQFGFEFADAPTTFD